MVSKHIDKQQLSRLGGDGGEKSKSKREKLVEAKRQALLDSLGNEMSEYDYKEGSKEEEELMKTGAQLRKERKDAAKAERRRIKQLESSDSSSDEKTSLANSNANDNIDNISTNINLFTLGKGMSQVPSPKKVLSGVRAACPYLFTLSQADMNRAVEEDEEERAAREDRDTLAKEAEETAVMVFGDGSRTRLAHLAFSFNTNTNTDNGQGGGGEGMGWLQILNRAAEEVPKGQCLAPSSPKYRTTVADRVDYFSLLLAARHAALASHAQVEPLQLQQQDSKKERSYDQKHLSSPLARRHLAGMSKSKIYV